MLRLLLASTFSLAALAIAPAAIAQQVVIPPVIKIIVPFASGSTTDVISRGVASQLATDR